MLMFQGLGLVPTARQAFPNLDSSRLKQASHGLVGRQEKTQRVAVLPQFVALDASVRRGCGKTQAVPPTVNPSIRSVGCPTPTGTLWPSLPHTPTPVSSAMSLPIMLTRVSASGPLPMMVAPLTGYWILPFSTQ
mmetsp:Transcript_34863/g.63558  ORF Transcript_34863/g.63558 Transcript_34863/m.63558 type:complete len:134 (+) Transcript_34863:448-849(+)